MHPALGMSAIGLAQAIREQRWSSREIVTLHIARAKEVAPRIRALVAERFAAALAEADVADAHLAAVGPAAVGPLHGVPCSIKECIAVTGMPQTSGLVARVGQAASEDAFTVARLRSAGAIPIGVSNVSELCMWWESDNRVYGRTHNPYDATRTVGGSSGGEGALVGAGVVPFGLGADVGGSIRMPAFFCGVFGHKPTGGLVSLAGHHPPPHGAIRRYCTIGPLARRAEDLMPLLRVLAGPDGEDRWMSAYPLGDPGAVALDGLQVLDVAGLGRQRPTPALVAAQGRAAAVLAGQGARVRQVELAGMRRAFDLWSAMLADAGGAGFGELLGHAGLAETVRHVLRAAVGRSPHTLPALALALLEAVPKRLPRRVKAYCQRALALKDEVHELLGDGVLLFPSHPRVAPKHHAALLAPLDFAWTGIWNILEVPVTQVPLGLDRAGLPLGIQVVGQVGQDHRTIAVAQALETHMGGWVRPM